MKLPELNWPWVAYFWIGCIWLGSIAHSAFRVLVGDDVTVIGVILQLIVASFAGLLAILIAIRFNWSAETAGIVCSIAGWAGGRFVQAVEHKVMMMIAKK
ncbi:hypothetical protein K3T42_000571 [Salmonella enterica subsp. enterica]|nr:hypothetical protein [Salmonella enterica subsp. enterica serovar Tennessee]EHX0851786.1 hypothetical protein [Salmonella enterica subsp. enterica]